MRLSSSLIGELPLSLLLLCLAAPSLAAPRVEHARVDGLHVPLRRRAAPERTAEWLQREKLKLETKYGSPAARKRSSGYNMLVNQDTDSSYYGSIAVGTPATAYDVILDTGSADLWLAASGCSSGCSSSIATFDGTSSSTFSNLSSSFSITYGSGVVNGYLVTDVVQMAGFEVSDQTFGACPPMSSGLVDAPVSGLLGLAWQGLSSTGAKPFWQQLYESGVLDTAEMGFFLTRYLNVSRASSLEQGGVFTLGATNTTLYTGSIAFQSLTQSDLYWTIALDSVVVGGGTVSMGSGSTNAVIDTGTTLIGGPSTEVANIYAQISGSQALSGSYNGYYSFPCSTSVNVSMTFGGRAWSIAPADFNLGQLDSSTCIGAFFVFSSSSTPLSRRASSSSSIAWIVGDTFLKNVYSVFRASPAAVGFAQLSDAALAMNGDTAASVPTPTIGAVSASVTGSSSSTRSNGATRSAASALLLAAAAGLTASALL
ncbi:aspartic peptidase domain-containing protein [Vararia minispora EC-137]|uniref:Aspartic peptidase domain-containing protein n=1 Tax=Vararia minispora EC-137 TaxID=1314806 RepID=A0ACB8Q924_9AGAM|nr:aspartic peptidase domain-containing protein [Vararia minispora EC-137]